ncbi:MAG: hypothetical protein AAGC55_04335, partial [Myxococcota bacterium]
MLHPNKNNSNWQIFIGLITLTAAACAVDGDIEGERADEVTFAGAPGLAPAHPYNCEQLDYGIYWYDVGDVSRKAGAAGEPIPGFYDPNAPTVLFVHGWQSGSVSSGMETSCEAVPGGAAQCSSGREEFLYNVPNRDGELSGEIIDPITEWKAQGFNVGIFHWTQLADDDGFLGIPFRSQAKIWTADYNFRQVFWRKNIGMQWQVCDRGQADRDQWPSKPAADLFLDSYVQALGQHQNDDIRLVGHSLGSQMVVRMAYLARTDARVIYQPQRIALVDPYWGPRQAIGGHHYKFLPDFPGVRKTPGDVIN